MSDQEPVKQYSPEWKRGLMAMKKVHIVEAFEECLKNKDRDIKALEVERDELQGTFDLQWAADMRAIKQWQAATGKDMEWPDRARMVVWLLERDAEQAKTIERLRMLTGLIIAEFVPIKHKALAHVKFAKLEEDTRE